MAELTRDEVIEHVKNKVSLEFANLAGLDLRGIDFRKVNLSGADLSGCRLQETHFLETNLTRAILYEADLAGSDLMGADLSNANLQKASLVEANMANAKLVNASLRQADLTQADCTNSDLARADLHFAKCSGTDFRRAVLAGADFGKAFLRGALFRGANIEGASFEGALGADPSLLKGGVIAEPDPEPQKPAPRISRFLGATGQKGPVDYAAPRPVEAPAAAARKSKYHPPLRAVPSVIFTTGGWIRGVFHVPTMHGFLEHLNLSGEMLKLTNVILPYLSLELRFFGLRRSKAQLVMPDCDLALLKLPEPTAEYHVHRVSFLLEGGTVTGSLAIEEDIRVSDYLANHNGFVALRNCRFGAHDAPVEEESHFPLLLVNCGTVVGASDERLREG
ncbi:MAG TPA: pentapeptide repeat-containing protein [Holophaga sp.]|nr:pentapeptide repeat-containing protein [Holophaga sp.]